MEILSDVCSEKDYATFFQQQAFFTITICSISSTNLSKLENNYYYYYYHLIMGQYRIQQPQAPGMKEIRGVVYQLASICFHQYKDAICSKPP